MRIIVTGSRTWTDYPVLAEALEGVVRWTTGPHTLVSGACPNGADALAEHWAENAAAMGYPWTVERHPADWERHAKGAGAIRNQAMIDLDADLVVGFVSACTNPPTSRCWSRGTHASHGTVDCLRKALDAGIPILTRTDMPRKSA
jgi:hypothetical protein